MEKSYAKIVTISIVVLSSPQLEILGVFLAAEDYNEKFRTQMRILISFVAFNFGS